MERIPDPPKVAAVPLADTFVLTCLYDAWMKDVVPALPTEPDATCANCPMLQKSSSDEGVFFNPSTKCCTYSPSLPNYLVGMILTDSDVAGGPGREVVEQRIASRTDVLPMGLLRPESRHREAPGNRDLEDFGRNPDRRCPYYRQETGLCAIWAHRNAVCATWFCKHRHGLRSLRFWRLTRLLLEHVESKLAVWAALQLGLSDQACLLLLPAVYALASTTGRDPTPADALRVPYGSAWGAWEGKEREYYLECARLVADLNWRDVKARVGPDAGVYELAVRRAHADLHSSDLPYAARPQEQVLDRFGHDLLGFRGYSAYDPFDVPMRTVAVLYYFQHAPVHEAVRLIQEREGITLTHDDVATLIDYGVLVPVQTGQS